MTKRKTLFYTIIFIISFMVGWGVFCISRPNHTQKTTDGIETNKYGAFLAAQHAIYVNDFETVPEFIKDFADVEYDTVKNTRILAEFLSGQIPTDVATLAKDMNPASRIIYDAYLAQNDKWDEIYKRRNTDKSAVYAPIRIWSAIAIDRKTETLKYIDSLDSNSSWKAFIRGQIYAEQGDTEKAAGAFANVSPDFMNINDYLYIMSFYRAHDMDDAAEQLRQDFSSNPGGMFMADYDDIPNWENFKGIKNALAFGLVQNVSHSQIMLYSDLSVLMLRFAQIIGPQTSFFQNTINYYLGQFFANMGGNYAKYMDGIDKNSPFYLFGKMRGDNSPKQLKKILGEHPLFIPALNKLVAHYTANGDRRGALRIINRALKNKKLSGAGRAYITKRRALVHLLFGDLNSAQHDIHDAAKILTVDAEILSIQARIWAAQGREIENAYDYAMTMIKRNPTDIVAWDTVAVVVGAREGNDAALEILEKVGGTANSCSSLFEHLGDAYAIKGDRSSARAAYMRAIELADDGLSIIPKIEKKLHKLK
ncbi:MAG: hypothetical protein IJQ90_04555 [Alphaproteobacteria bacterium]|nr:hypothetical protein [Alphaproteobacteria bacterium]